MTIQQAQQQLRFQLNHIYSDAESNNIADWVMERITGLPRIDRVTNKTIPLLPAQLTQLDSIQIQLLTHKPIQYILNECWFYGMKLYVDENVLIPRPETEELVDWLVKEVKASGRSDLKILDIGTGSGCIPLAIKKALPGCEVYALDISKAALNVARKNAQLQNLAVHFFHFDIFSDNIPDQFPRFDIIVSNPPYIPLSDKSSMADNVVKFEPWLALFVDNEDPLLFYKSILQFSKAQLTEKGVIFFEVHEALGNRLYEYLKNSGMENIQLSKDLQGKDRMICIRE